METIKNLLDQDYLQIEEFHIFNAVEKWIKHNITEPEESLKDILIRKIRFLSMTPNEFVGGPGSTKLLKTEDSYSLLSNLIDKNCLIPFPEGFTKAKRSSGLNRLMLTSLPSLTSSREDYDIKVHVNKKIWLSHLIIYPLVTDEEYEEIIRIRFRQESILTPIEIPIFYEQVAGSNNIKVKLSEPLQLKPGKSYDIDIWPKSGNRKCVNLPGNVINSGNVSFSFEEWINPECPLHSILFYC